MPEISTHRSRVDIERLTRRMGKYALVVAVSQRARQLKDRQTQLADLTPSDLVGRALNEIADAKVKLLEEQDEV
ncbi:MAG: DNA-directed RNA polymerase subunit omega [Armatimonadota bacterium]